tara:strand:- start:387 stop:704 length:318 start_codon:yes stop_codon:yes gene_type:complete
MKTIDEIKEYCVQVDLNDPSNESTEDDIRSFYDEQSLEYVLEIYSTYLGLEDYKRDNPEDYKKTYGLDILSVLEFESSNYMVDMPFFKETMDHLDNLTIRGKRND